MEQRQGLEKKMKPGKFQYNSVQSLGCGIELIKPAFVILYRLCIYLKRLEYLRF